MPRKLLVLTLAPVLGAAWLAPPGALAAPPATPSAAGGGSYSASAHGDLLAVEGLDVLPDLLPSGGSLATAAVAHSRSTADSDAATRAVAESSNLDADVLFESTPVQVSSMTATAPPSSGPAGGTLVDPPLEPLLDVNAVQGSVVARDGQPCAPSVAGERLVSRSTTQIDGTTVAESTVPGLAYLAQVEASQVTTSTALLDQAGGTAAVQAITRTSVGDVRLLGGAATVQVSSPVLLRATSDGTTGTAGFASPPTVRVNVGGSTIPVPLNATPVTVPVSIPANPAVSADLRVTAFDPSNSSSGARGEAHLDELVRIDMTVKLAGTTIGEVALGTAPMSVSAGVPGRHQLRGSSWHRVRPR